MTGRSWSSVIGELVAGRSLSRADAAWAMGEIMAGDATAAQIAGFLVALRAKGETVTEFSGLAEVMLAHATPVSSGGPAVDVVGTGGDRAHTVNISTMAAIVVAGTGIPVIKQGNRAVSSKCGAADVLEELGVPLDLTPDGIARCVADAGIGFCFAPRHHPGMRHAAGVRRELGVPTTFNFLGPLCNPARPSAAVIGCADIRMAPLMAHVVAERGQRGQSVLVVRGEDGLDEITTTAATRVWTVSGGQVHERVIDAADLGVPRAAPGDLHGGDPTFNAEMVRRVLAGESGPVRDAVTLNAAAALAVFGAGDLEYDLTRGMALARRAIDTGTAAWTLARWIAVARAARPA